MTYAMTPEEFLETIRLVFDCHNVFDRETIPGTFGILSDLIKKRDEAIRQAEREKCRELVEALKAAQGLELWIAERVSAVAYETEELKKPLSEVKAWQELDESVFNGWLASHRDQFSEALAQFDSPTQPQEAADGK